MENTYKKSKHKFQTTEVLSDLILHKQVFLKVSILAWRLLQNRLLTKDNLFVHGVLPHDNQHCVVGCGGIETAQHILCSCLFYAALWGQIRSWLGIASYSRAIICVLSFLSVCLFCRRPAYHSLFYATYMVVFCGLKETVGSSKIWTITFTNWQRKSNYILYGRWRLLIFLFVIIFICGDQALLFVLALARLSVFSLLSL